MFLGLAALSAVLVRVMISVGALDIPVDRSSHAVPTPKGGGVGIVAAYAAGTIWSLRGADGWTELAAVLALACVSYVDDVRNWPFAVKLVAQLAAALAVMGCGHVVFGVALPGAGVLPLGLAGVALTLGWLLFVTNAVNFIDGLNGLAAGCTLVACLLAAAASPHLLFYPAGALAAGIVGFLPFNYPRARIFMGDVGSQVCGFLLADFSVLAAGDARASLVVPLALLPILADVAFTLARRALQGARLTQAHRGHLYQVAQRSGVAAARVSALYWGFSAWGGVCGLLAGRLAAAWGAPVACGAALLPLLPWALYVARRAKQAGITAW
ncbi:MAG: undecaprenyl/decaprenyl-phosphate alpha-N-acetylglucosaminyl 1-phosphate transferase [Rhodospirillales bacterium]